MTKYKALALTNGEYLQGDKVIYFFSLDSFKFLFSLAISLQVIFSWPNSYQSFNLSRALCNCIYRLRVELFLFCNWPLHAEKPLGHKEGQPGKWERRREWGQRKISLKHEYICMCRLWLVRMFGPGFFAIY